MPAKSLQSKQIPQYPLNPNFEDLGILTSLSEVIFQLNVETQCIASLSIAVGAVAYGSISEGVLAGIRKWHGSIDDQFGNIDNLVNLVTEHQP